MIEKSTCQIGITKMMAKIERDWREMVVVYARPFVDLGGFSLSELDEAHAQRFIN